MGSKRVRDHITEYSCPSQTNIFGELTASSLVQIYPINQSTADSTSARLHYLHHT